MVRRIVGVAFAVAVVSLTLAQEPRKDPPGKAQPKPKDRPAPEQIVDLLLQRMDTNKDGKISKSEAQNRVADGFDRIDTNKDGYLDRSELRAMARVMAPPPGGGPGGPAVDPLDFDARDRNADGRLTREELRGSRFADAFDQIDANTDGKIDPKEWAAYHKRGK